MVTVKYPNAFFDSAEDTPLQVNYKEELFQLNLNQLYMNRQYMKRLTVRDDQHWMLKDVKEDYSLTPDEVPPPEYIPHDWSIVIKAQFYIKFFYMSKKEEIATRQFMKVQELGAIVGGFFKIVMMNFMFLAQTYSGFYVVYFYLQNLFSVEKKVLEITKPADLSVNNYTNETALTKVTQSLGQTQLSIFAYYFRCCRRQSAEQVEAVKSFQAAEGYLKKRLDVKYLMEHFEKFESLCEMILTEEQKEALRN